MQISRTPLSCSLCRKVYETQPIGGAFNPVGHQHLLHTIQPLPPSSSCISSVSGLADCRAFLSDAPASHHCQRNYETTGLLRSPAVTAVHGDSIPFPQLL